MVELAIHAMHVIAKGTLPTRLFAVPGAFGAGSELRKLTAAGFSAAAGIVLPRNGVRIVPGTTPVNGL